MKLTNPTRNGNTASLPLKPTYVINAKPSSEITQDKENTVSLCSSKKNDIEKCANSPIKPCPMKLLCSIDISYGLFEFCISEVWLIQSESDISLVFSNGSTVTMHR